MPLPPYIDRDSEDGDKDRYQTVYCREEGSVAAPTAGLHFTKEILDKLEEQGTKHCFVTLNVGLGTFKPVKCENIVVLPIFLPLFFYFFRLVSHNNPRSLIYGRFLRLQRWE